jgi:hypothetical protein
MSGTLDPLMQDWHKITPGPATTTIIITTGGLDPAIMGGIKRRVPVMQDWHKTTQDPPIIINGSSTQTRARI